MEVLGCDRAAAPLLLLGRLWAAAAKTPDMSAAAQLSRDCTSRTCWSGEASGRLPIFAKASQGLAAPGPGDCDLPEAGGEACWVSMRCWALGACCGGLLLGSVLRSKGEILSRDGRCVGAPLEVGASNIWAAGTGIAQASSDMTVPAESVLPRDQAVLTQGPGQVSSIPGQVWPDLLLLRWLGRRGSWLGGYVATVPGRAGAALPQGPLPGGAAADLPVLCPPALAGGLDAACQTGAVPEAAAARGGGLRPTLRLPGLMPVLAGLVRGGAGLVVGWAGLVLWGAGQLPAEAGGA